MAQRDDPFAAGLPPVLMRALLLRLPLDARARCACVCRSWRAAVDDPELWTRLFYRCGEDDESATRWRRFSAAALRAVTARAGGRLETLKISELGHDTLVVLRDVVAANASTLREMRLSSYLDSSQLPLLLEMLRTAPALELSAEVMHCGPRDGQALLSGRPPWNRLLLQKIHLDWRHDDTGERGFGIVGLSTIPELEIWGGNGEDVPLTLLELPALNVIADAVLVLGVTMLTLHGCLPMPSAAPALARLLSTKTLTELTLVDVSMNRFAGFGVHMLTGASAELVASALRANATLQRLELPDVLLWEDAGAAVALLRGLVGHASLRRLNLTENTIANRDVPDLLAIGAVLGALVEANGALEELDLVWCDLRDPGLGPLIAALARNTNLRALRIDGNNMSLAFLNQQVVPAVRANTSLRHFNPGIGCRTDLEPENTWEAHERLSIRLSAYVEARECARQAAEKLDEAWTGA